MHQASIKWMAAATYADDADAEIASIVSLPALNISADVKVSDSRVSTPRQTRDSPTITIRLPLATLSPPQSPPRRAHAYGGFSHRQQEDSACWLSRQPGACCARGPGNAGLLTEGGHDMHAPHAPIRASVSEARRDSRRACSQPHLKAAALWAVGSTESLLILPAGSSSRSVQHRVQARAPSSQPIRAPSLKAFQEMCLSAHPRRAGQR